MKSEFGNINDSHIAPGKIFYLYGNYKKTFGLFCDFIVEKFRNKCGYPSENIEVFFCNVAECIKITNSSCDLFGKTISFFCIRNIEDGHLDKLNTLFKNTNTVFILESGDYSKSKKITETFTKSENICAVASFKNDITLVSLCKLMLPAVSHTIYREIVSLINDTDEDLASLFKKISLLLDDSDNNLLKKYTTYKRFFLDDMDFIPLLRYVMKLAIKEKLGGKSSGGLKIDFSQKNIIESLLNAEIKQKLSYNFPKSYVSHLCGKSMA